MNKQSKFASSSNIKPSGKENYEGNTIARSQAEIAHTARPKAASAKSRDVDRVAEVGSKSRDQSRDSVSRLPSGGGGAGAPPKPPRKKRQAPLPPPMTSAPDASQVSPVSQPDSGVADADVSARQVHSRTSSRSSGFDSAASPLELSSAGVATATSSNDAVRPKTQQPQNVASSKSKTTKKRRAPIPPGQWDNSLRITCTRTYW